MATLYTNFRWAYSGEPQEMLVESGRVVRRGPELSAERPSDVQDLAGKWMLPAFVDSHCHILPTGLDLLKLHLGPASSPSDVLDLLRERHREQPDGWLHAVHYDQNRYPGGAHMTRDHLDAISSTRPILLRHVNGHASVANSAALLAGAIDDITPDPAGGTIVRDSSGRATGVLLENAHEQVSSAAPGPTFQEMVDAILLAGDKMRELGICCATDMMTGRFNLREELLAYQTAAEKGSRIATRLYLQWREVFGPRGISPEELNDLITGLDAKPGNGVKVAGIKIFADGAIGSATAAIYGKYQGQGDPSGPRITRHGHDAGATSETEVSGQLIYRPDKLKEMVRVAHDAGWPVAIHSIGDYSTDLVMAAFESTGEPSRHRIEHAMILSDAQIARIAALGCSVSFQPEFLLRFGHTYRAQLGEAKAAMLKRTRSVLDAGIPLSFSSDRPIVAGDPWDGIRMAELREGFDLSERCTRREAIDAYTVSGSEINGDGRDYGTLDEGSYAEFQLFEANPFRA